MSSTRIIFIVACVVIAVILIGVGIIVQRNSPDSRYSVTGMVKTAGAKRKKGLRIPKNASSYLTIVLVIVALILFFVFSR